MYEEILNDIGYQILFDFGVFDDRFWIGTYFLSGAFFAFWGVKLGAKFLREAILGIGNI